MTEADVMLPPAGLEEADTASRPTMAAVALVSFSSLLLELALTRIFSVVLFYHFAFLAISLALLGLGTGGVFAFLKRSWLKRWSVQQLGWALCLANAVVIAAVVAIDLRIPVQLELDWPNFGRLSVIYLVSAVPFFLTGLLFSVLFARQTRHVAQYYAADLGGGALACLAISPLLNYVGGPNAVLFAAGAMAMAAALWAETLWRRWAGLLLAILGLVLILLNVSYRFLDIVYAKGVERNKPWVEFARWNALSRVEVDDLGRGARNIVIDADASTPILWADQKFWSQPKYRDQIMGSAPGVVNAICPHGDYAIIGPGGGVDVLRALLNGSPSITGIEINPLIANDIMRDRYLDFSGHLYELPQVHIYVSDGRSWVGRSQQKFDVLQMTLVDTWASTAAGAFALSENNLYTVEAFREYFDHLKPDGMIAITRWEFRRPREALRVVSQAMAALREMGVTDFRSHFIVVSQGALDEDGRPVVVLAKKSAFTAEEEAALTADTAQYPYLQILYRPTGTPAAGNPAADAPTEPDWRAFAALILQGSPERFASRYAYDVRPVYDNAPFFFFTIKTRDVMHEVLHPGHTTGIDWKVNLGVAVLLAVLVLSFIAVGLFLIGPLVLSREARTHAGFSLFYFLAIGLGYILVEIAFIQRFVLFLGHPTYAVTVVIFLMLLASGVGSLLSPRWLREPSRVRIPLSLIAMALLAYVGFLPGVLRSLVGLPFTLKLAVSGLLLLPLGLAMGMPFPSGLQALAAKAKSRTEAAVEWAWAVNAGASVLGSVLAMFIAINSGLNVTLACGAVAYGAALLLTASFRQTASP